MGIACDPNFSQVSLLLHCDGTNGSTSFPDSSSNNLTVTASGTCQVSTAQVEFGTGSAVFANSGGLAAPIVANGPMDLSSGDFTIEFWFNPGTQVSGQGAVLYTSDSYFSMYYNKGANKFAGQIFGGTLGQLLMPVGTWVAVALVASGTHLLTYVNGTQLSSTTMTRQTLTAPSLNFGNDSSQPFTGNFDEIRVTKGLARYTGASYTPSGPFSNFTCTPVVPNVAGLTRAAATAALTAAGFQFTITEVEQNHQTVPVGSVISQNPVGGAPFQIGSNVTITVSAGPVPAAGVGGDQWGANGGGQPAVGNVPLLGPALATAQQPDNAITQGNQSVLAALATGATLASTVAPITQATPAPNVPTTPAVG